MLSTKATVFTIGALVPLLAMQNLDYHWHRLTTVARAVKSLYQLPKEDFEAFVRSYVVYNQPQNNSDDEVKVVETYKILSLLLELGDLEKMYIPPLMDATKSMVENQKLFEEMMADELALRPGQMALDLGCGKGLIADTVQRHTGAKIEGMNIDPWQLERARENAGAKLGTLLEFRNGSVNDPLPYPDNSVDAVYGLQAWTHVHNLSQMLREVRRVLKPGGMVSTYDAVTTDKYDPSNATQYKMFQHTRQVSVAPNYPLVRDYENAFIGAGFQVKRSEFLGHSHFLETAANYYQPLGTFMKFLGRVGLVPEYVLTAMDRMNEYKLDILAGDREGLFTTGYWIVATAK